MVTHYRFLFGAIGRPREELTSPKSIQSPDLLMEMRKNSLSRYGLQPCHVDRSMVSEMTNSFFDPATIVSS